jgi:inositol polyphosphate 5-phosphatase INPP5B/F
LTFVNAHLAAFDEALERRNTEFHDLSKRLSFDVSVPDPPVVSVSTPSSRAASIPPTPVFDKSKATWPPEDWEQNLDSTSAPLSPVPRTVMASVFDSDVLFWVVSKVVGE